MSSIYGICFEYFRRAALLEGGWGELVASLTTHGKLICYGAPVILEQFSTERQRFQAYMQDVPTIEQQLAAGEAKARTIATQTLGKVRTKLGYAQVTAGK